MRVAVLGAGGVGGFLAAMLVRAGASVLVIANEGTARALAREGLSVESGRFGDFRVSVRTTSRLAEHVDACLIAVKATHLREAIDRVPPNALGGALVVPFLNGIEHVDYLRGVYPPENVAAAAIRIETTRVQPGVIRHTSPFAAVEIARSETSRDAVQHLAETLRVAGLDVRIRDDERALLWDKFVFLAPLALLTTQERGNLGVIRTRRRNDAVAMIGEAASVAEADGVAIDRNQALKMLDSAPSSMESSMQRDQAAGRPLELDALGGALLRRAAVHGVPVPVTERVVAELQMRGRTAGAREGS
ncbi:MAG TPA: 2-dehydropantoate 2-reductase [Candidatus Dormibacteraeota bacterium]|nr:2-dehydropantoate 2-reductase [Candidatus Dormibacteraeota bacterium]